MTWKRNLLRLQIKSIYKRSVISLFVSCVIFISSFYLSFPLTLSAAEDGKTVDVALVMDSSGSMKKTDPSGLSKAAARLFISLLMEKDRVGLVSFSDAAYPLLGLAETGDARNRKKVLKSLEKVGSSGKYTDIYAGVQKGYELLKASTSKERLIILMSDGQMDLGDKSKEEALLKEFHAILLPEIKKAGVRIYTIAFTNLSDHVLLEEIALKTDGKFRVAKTDKDLHLAFTSIFEGIKSPEALPISGNIFEVDKDIQEFTLIITKKTPKTRLAIKDPSGKEHKAVRHGPDIQWFESGAFDLVTAKNPTVGRWEIILGSEQGNKAFIITNLALQSSFNSSTVHQGQTLKFDAWLAKDKEILKAKEILEHLKVIAFIKTPEGKENALLLHDDGLNGDIAIGDGIYTAEITPGQTGEYSLRLMVEGETFKREKVFVYTAVKPPVEVVKAAPAVPVAPKPVEVKKEKYTLHIAGFVTILILAVAVILLTVLSVYLYLGLRKYKESAVLAGKQKSVSSGLPEKNTEEKQPGKEAQPVALNELGVVMEKQLEKDVREAAIEELEADNKRLKEMVDKQAAKITELMEYRILISETQKRFELIKISNDALKDRLADLAGRAEGFEEIKEMLADFERNNKELEASLSILEGENSRLTDEFTSWQKDAESLLGEREQESAAAEERYLRLLQEKKNLEESVKELTESLEVTEQSLFALQKKHKELEHEYSILYKEQQQ